MLIIDEVEPALVGRPRRASPELRDKMRMGTLAALQQRMACATRGKA